MLVDLAEAAPAGDRAWLPAAAVAGDAPITPGEAWKAHVGGDPNLRILLLLMATIGLPYFVLSSTGPLMQQWFSQTNPGVSPYRLYALSNVGSLLALLSYPVFFKVRFPRHTQATMWSVGLAVFVAFCGYCAWMLWRHANALPAAAPTPAPAPTSAPASAGIEAGEVPVAAVTEAPAPEPAVTGVETSCSGSACRRSPPCSCWRPRTSFVRRSPSFRSSGCCR